MVSVGKRRGPQKCTSRVQGNKTVVVDLIKSYTHGERRGKIERVGLNQTVYGLCFVCGLLQVDETTSRFSGLEAERWTILDGCNGSANVRIRRGVFR